MCVVVYMCVCVYMRVCVCVCVQDMEEPPNAHNVKNE